jgi:hypothetical protein
MVMVSLVREERVGQSAAAEVIEEEAAMPVFQMDSHTINIHSQMDTLRKPRIPLDYDKTVAHIVLRFSNNSIPLLILHLVGLVEAAHRAVSQSQIMA